MKRCLTGNLRRKQDMRRNFITALEGGGTAYYVGDIYGHISFDNDKDGQADRLILISVDESDEETIKPESLAWLERL